MREGEQEREGGWREKHRERGRHTDRERERR